jgi:hypothetical protein
LEPLIQILLCFISLFCVIMFLRNALIFFLSIYVLLGCREKPSGPTLFSVVDNSQVTFTNTLAETRNDNVFTYRNFYNGGGVASGDLNNDGLPELFFTANQSSNKLFVNKGHLQFEDITEKAGFSYHGEWSTGVVFVDINADGWLDIYVCNAGNMTKKELRRNQLFINNRNLTFSEEAAKYGLDNDGYSTQASFFDYDLDGDLDCFLVNNSPIPVNTLNYANMRSIPDAEAPFADFLKGGGDHLYRNDGGKFVDVSREAGIYGSIISFGLGVTVGDVNDDGYPDVYVSNDFFEKDYLYMNQRNGTFKDEIEDRTQHISFSSMGADMQDINNDGRQDIFTTDMLPGDDYRLKTNSSFEGYEIMRLKQNQGFFNQYTQNSLQVNNGQGKFLETGFYSGVAASDWSWGALMFDADNDGLSDIFVCNGIYRDVTDQDFIEFFANEVVGQMALSGKKEEVEKVIDQMPSVPLKNKFFRNEGALRFSDAGDQWGLDQETFSNGATYADLDNDGDLDLVINNVNQPAVVYRNNSRDQQKSNYLGLTLTYPSPNRFAVGAKVKVFCGDQIIVRELIPSRGFQSSVDYKIIVGTGDLAVDSLQVVWPNRSVTIMVKPELNKTLAIDFDKVVHTVRADAGTPQLFSFAAVNLPVDTLKEDDHVDFYAERNMPFMLSKQGPKAAVGDVNGDGLEDVFIGSPVQQDRHLLLQTSKGAFIEKEVPDFKKIRFHDVTAAFFFDADQDGDLDLFTGGGGNVEAATSEVYQNHIYLNNGKGDFAIKPGNLPISYTNCGAAIPLDYNDDGKMDIFVGGRSVPQQYGINPQSFLYENKGNAVFEDVTSRVAPSLSQLGMITGADWKDVNGDQRKELIVVGEWMHPLVFETKGFKEIKTGLEELYGWWQTLSMHDVDGDGDQDLLLGNLGENFYLKAATDRPVKLWIKDFDKNGAVEKVFSHHISGRDVPVFLKKDLTEQIPSLKKLNLKHKDFATRSIQELFKDQMQQVKVLQVNYTSSCIAYNNGKGMFTIKAFPIDIQLSSVNAFHVADLTGDGKDDLVVGGNFFDLLPQFCRIDASYMNILKGDGKGGYDVIPAQRTGLSLNGQVRDILKVKIGKQDAMLILQNDSKPLMLSSRTNGKQ